MLQSKHNSGKILDRNSLSLSQLTDGIILAIHTLHIAA
jgi:hypothetical protein